SGHDHRCWDLPEYHDLLHRALRWTARDDTVSWLAPGDLPKLHYRPAAAPRDPDNPVGPLNQIQNPLSPENSLKLAQVPPGFEISLFAAEPMVVNPIAMNWDQEGRLWVVEAFDYPHKIGTGDPQDRIKILEDRDRDGRADTVTVFAGGLNICTSVLPVPGGAIATDGPDMVLLRDEDGDGKADRKDVLWSGIGLRDTHACVSNLRHGFDGWIYATVGYSGLDVTVNGRQHKSSQAVFRFLPDGSAFEIVQGTSNNTWGLGFTEEGDLVGSTANGNASWYLSIPNRHFESLGRKGQQVARADGPEFLAPITSDYFQNNPKEKHSSAAGHAVYTSRRFPEDWWNKRVLVCEPPMHLVSAPGIRRRGDRFETTGFEHNLYASADAWSAPVAAEVGPDGAIWMADWYNPICNHNPYRKHFQKGPGNALRSDDRDREHGRIYRIYPRGTQDDPYPNLQTGPAALVALEHPNLFWRLTAQRLLAGKLDSKTLAAKSNQSRNPRTRFHLALAAHHRRLDAVQAAAIARRIGLDEGGRNQAVVQSSAVSLKRLQDAGRDPLDRKAAALRLVEAPPSARLGEDLLHLVTTDSTIAANNHLADAVRLAVIRHPEGFFRALLEEKGEHKPEGLLGRIVRDALVRIRGTPEIISKGLRAFAHQSDTGLAKRLAEATEAGPPTAPKTTLSLSARRGEQVYLACCVACHQPEGKGLPKVFPPLAGSKRLLGPTEVPVRIVLKGLQGPLEASGEQYDSMMPGHEALLTDQQVADVLNYTRASWGNTAGEVSEESVRSVRTTVARRTSPWTEPELRSRK
ncbi:MAG: c-type cytochrome, partial [Roseibacillus sp.]|nr:c-type cytochrome [Roseibacillus sp.]